MTETLHGIIPPLSTPMTEDFEIDRASLQRLIEFQLAAGVHGIFVLGSTSEAVLLTDKQRRTVMDVAVSTVGGRVLVVAGVIDMTTARVIEHAREAEKAGVQGLVVTAPFYIRIQQEEILEHFRLVHAASGVPLIAYDIPSAVHTKLERKTIIRMIEEGLIVGLKDSSGDEANFRLLAMEREKYPNFALFTGSELLGDAAMLYGAHGIVPGLGNVDPHGYVRLYEAARSGDWESARREQERLIRLFEIISSGMGKRMGIVSSALGGFKTALQLRGIIATNVVGRPMIRLNEEEVEFVRGVLVEAGLLE